MSILEDLDLLDLPDDLPDGADFDLDDILFEFSTPGLYTAPAPIEEEPLPEILPEDNTMVETMTFTAVSLPEAEETPAVPEVVTVEPEAFFAETEEEPVPQETEDAYHGDLFGDPFGLGDILYEFGTPVDEDGVKVYSPAAKPAAPMEEEVKVYAPKAEEVPAIPFAAPVSEETVAFTPVEIEDEGSPQPAADATIAFAPVEPVSEETVPFTAVEDAPVYDSAEATMPFAAVTEPAPAPKAPGLFAKIAAAVMGLFSSKKKQPAHLHADAPAARPAEDDPFLQAEALFTAQDLGADGDLLLELEIMAELEAERTAKQAAWEAEERIVTEAEPEPEIPAAILELQREADEAAAEAERLAAEQARLEAEEAARAAAEEAQLQALAEEELFAWIESTNQYRGKAIAREELPVFEEAPPTEEVPVSEDTMAFPIEEAPDVPVLEEDEDDVISAAPMTEESSAEILSLLENPDIDPEGQAAPADGETEEEAAARRAKAEEDLHYKPDEAPAKAISSHIGKRFGAVFSMLTEADGPGDDEDTLGPEVSPTKAYRYFNKFINDYRFRLRVSAVLSVIMGWIALGLPVFGSLKNPAVASAMCLMLLLTIMLAGADILAAGVRSLIRRRPGIHGLVAVSCIASVVDALVIIACKGKGGYLPFCAVSGISMCFAIYGSLLYCRGQRLNFKTLEQCAEPLTISVDYGIVDEETTTVYRTIGYPEQYIHRSEEEDLSETVYGMIAPLLIPAVPVLALLAALLSKGLGDFFHILAAMYAAAASFSALVAFPLPYFLTQRDLYATKAAIAGWAGAKDIGRVSTMIVTDRDLFPDETVSIKSVRIVDEVNPDLTLSYFCSMIKKSGSCLVPAFDQLAENNDCQLREVENFQCHEAGGLSGTIGPDEVLIASHSYMKLQGFRIPARKKDSENALFMAANGHVIAYIVMEYKPIKSVRAGLESALRGSVEMIFAARDFNITPLLISKKFKSPTDTLRFPSYSQRYEITDRSGSDTAMCAAVVSRKSFFSYAAVVEKARYLYRSVSLSVMLSVVSGLMGMVLMFVMALTGAGQAVTVGRLLIFMLLWLVPTLALTVSITK